MKCVISDTATFRRAIEEMAELLSALPERVRFDSRLVASELITNALKYGGGKPWNGRENTAQNPSRIKVFLFFHLNLAYAK